MSTDLPKSFVERVNTLAHAKGTEEELFDAIERPYTEDADSPVGVATCTEWEVVNKLLESLDLPPGEYREWEDAVGSLVCTTQHAAFACGLAASSISGVLFAGNGKKGK